MLLAIRSKVQGWIAWAIVIALIIPFALWGIDQYATGDRIVVVAEVNDERISATEFMQVYNTQRIRLRQQFGDMYDQVVEDEELREQVLDSLITSELIRQWAHANRVVITDAQLAAVIQGADVFYDENGVFSQRIYQDLLARNGFTPATFERDQRNFLLETQFQNLMASSTPVFPFEKQALLELQTQTRHIDYVRVDQRVFNKEADITDEQIAQFYTANEDDFMLPERVSLEYVTLSLDDLAKDIDVTERQVADYFELNQRLFAVPEQRRASHILLSDQGEDTLAKLSELQQRLADGEDFAALAQAYSQDPGSARQGGDLDFFEAGMMVDEFDRAVFDLEMGQVSEPILTEFGYHLIKLTDIKAMQMPSLDDIRDDVVQQVRLEQAERVYFEMLEDMTQIAFEQPDSLEPIITQLNLQVATTTMVERSGGSDEVTSRRNVMEAAFSEDVLQQRLNSAPVEIGPNKTVVVRIAEHQPSRLQPLSEVRDDIERQLVREFSIARSAERAKSLLTQVRDGVAVETLIGEGVEWHPVGWISRENQQILPQITAAAFAAAKPRDNQPTWNKVQLVTGDSVLVRVNEIGRSEQADDATLRNQLARILQETYQTAEVESLMASLRLDAKIEKRSNYLSLR
ncbi:SurA N-terminal domain-containing protein [Thiomicrospira sp. ALE5]|uniref:SurA N-terminal domain-containing protein n=1 Tax=Thiomicrospira sp. ALE5 TaxID=748650 RepID=UPI0008E8297F|nr:SurA N-terminal domain-containing protein [Thiomicrospira sp. ALE5]SFR50335.1 peptidyl-prolyl cis-trans isomerase D [Thiomicrospira sp. ALE5]